jgi:hypothetical protein
MKRAFLLLAMILAVQGLPAQMAGNSSFAPMHVYVNGAGHIYPSYDEKMLRIGRGYAMTAIPARGYKFASWQPVDVTTLTLYAEDSSGSFEEVTNTTINLAENQYVMDPVLTFRMKPADIVSSGGLFTITESTGWQANFVPKYERVPRPPRQEILNNP